MGVAEHLLWLNTQGVSHLKVSPPSLEVYLYGPSVHQVILNEGIPMAYDSDRYDQNFCYLEVAMVMVPKILAMPMYIASIQYNNACL